MVRKSQLTLQCGAETKEAEASAQITVGKRCFKSGRNSDLKAS